MTRAQTTLLQIGGEIGVPEVAIAVLLLVILVVVGVVLRRGRKKVAAEKRREADERLEPAEGSAPDEASAASSAEAPEMEEAGSADAPFASAASEGAESPTRDERAPAEPAAASVPESGSAGGAATARAEEPSASPAAGAGEAEPSASPSTAAAEEKSSEAAAPGKDPAAVEEGEAEASEPAAAEEPDTPSRAAEEAAEAAAAEAAEEEKVEEPAPATMRSGLGKTRREGFIARLGKLFSQKRTISDDVMEELEEVLFTADIGVRTADRLLERVRDELSGKELDDSDRVWEVLRAEARSILQQAASHDERGTPGEGEPHVTMILGVNGSGKTTTIAKLARRYQAEGRSVLLVAGDTFRAAAAEQLEHWGHRVGVPVHRGKEGADPGSVVFDGVERAAEEGFDEVLIDTAGRLHTQTNLMEELKKVRRVTGKALQGAPHDVELILDATTGQNAVQQAKTFLDAADVTGLVLAKLDGTAKGGIVLGVCDELGLPVRYVGVGERVQDIRPFDAEEFVEALFEAGSD